MDKYLLVFFVALFSTFGILQAQTLELDNGSILYEKEKRQAVMVTMDPEPKEVKKAWKKFIQKNYDENVEGLGLFTNKEVLTSKKANIEIISEKEMDLYAEIVEVGENTQMNVFAALGYDIYLNPETHPKEYDALEGLVIDFLNDFLPDHIQENVEDIEDNLADLKDEKSTRLKKIKKNKDDVAQMEQKIKDLKKDNLDYEKEIVDLTDSIKKTESKLKIKRKGLNRVVKDLGTTNIK